jgi:hypothetical protein
MALLRHKTSLSALTVSRASKTPQSSQPYFIFPSGGLNPGFERACTICADMSQLARTLKPKSGLDGGTFLEVLYQVGITFGGTELKAFVQWKENVRIMSSLHGMRWCA